MRRFGFEYDLLVRGACLSVLEHRYGGALLDYLRGAGLLMEDGYEQRVYCCDGYEVGVEAYNPEREDEVYVTGMVGDEYVHQKVPLSHLKRWKVNFERFMAHVLSFETLGIKATNKGILRKGCRKLGFVAHLGIHLYYCETGSESELYGVEKDAETLDKRVVIITGGRELQGDYAARYEMGDFQYIPLSSLFYADAGGEVRKELLSEHLLHIGKAPTKPPFFRYPRKTENLTWEDIKLDFCRQDVTVIVKKRPPHKMLLSELPVFCRPVNARSVLGSKMNFIAAAAYAGGWRKLGDNARQILHRVDEGLRLFFGIKEHAYAKGEDGVYRFLPSIKLSPDFKTLYEEPEARSEVEDAFRFDTHWITQNGKQRMIYVPSMA